MELSVERRDPRAIGPGSGLELTALGPWLSAVGPVAVVDLETTGLAASRSAEVIEIGILLLDPGRGDRWSCIDVSLPWPSDSASGESAHRSDR